MTNAARLSLFAAAKHSRAHTSPWSRAGLAAYHAEQEAASGAGATGLEPATSGVTGRTGALAHLAAIRAMPHGRWLSPPWRKVARVRAEGRFWSAWTRGGRALAGGCWGPGGGGAGGG